MTSEKLAAVSILALFVIFHAAVAAVNGGCLTAGGHGGGCMLVEKCHAVNLSDAAIYKAHHVNHTCGSWLVEKSSGYLVIGCYGDSLWRAYAIKPLNVSGVSKLRIKAEINGSTTTVPYDGYAGIIVSSSAELSGCEKAISNWQSECIVKETSLGTLGQCSLPKYTLDRSCDFEAGVSGYDKVYLTFTGNGFSGLGQQFNMFGNVEVCETMVTGPPDCSSYRSCAACVSSGCGWCADMNTCAEGEMRGPYGNTCSDLNWVWGSSGNCQPTPTSIPTLMPAVTETATASTVPITPERAGIIGKIANAIASIFRGFLAPFLQG